jgi:hypothetical protein
LALSEGKHHAKVGRVQAHIPALTLQNEEVLAELASLLSKVPDSKYFWFCRSYIIVNKG